MRMLYSLFGSVDPLKPDLRLAVMGAFRRVAALIRIGESPPSVVPLATERDVSGSRSKAQNAATMLKDMSERLDGWIWDARHAAGSDVVVMFSIESMYDPTNSSRPAQLASVLLEEDCPVFFNFNEDSSGGVASHHQQGLIQSQTEMTSRVLPQLLEADFGDKRKVLMIGFPHELMVRYMSYAEQHGWQIVYDVYMDWEECARLNRNLSYEPEYEWYISRNAHAVFGVSGALARKLETISARGVAVLPNAPNRSLPVAPAAGDFGQFVVGFFAGGLDVLIDWDLVIRCARRYSSVLFELAGSTNSVDRPVPGNLRLLGPISSEERSRLISRWGGGMVPFIFGPVSESIDPIELHDLVGAGLPVVTTYLPQVRDYPGVKMAESPEEFIDLVGSLVETTRVELEPDQAWLAANRWVKRAEELRQALDRAPQPRPMVAYLTGTVR